MNLFSRRAVPFWVLFVLIPLFCIRLFLLVPRIGDGPNLSTPEPTVVLTITAPDAPPNQINQNAQSERPVQRLYQIEYEAFNGGWTPRLYRQAGDLWRDVGDITQAVALWESAAAETADAALLRDLGTAYVELQRWSDAATTFKRLLDIAPEESWAHFQLGLLMASSDPAQAADHLRQALGTDDYALISSDLLSVLETYPDDTLLGLRVGLLLAEHNLWPFAELAFEQATTVAPDMAEAYAYVGLARDRQGKEGGTWLEQALALAPENAQIYYLLGLHLRTHDDKDGSLQAFQQAVALEPENPAYYAELGTAYRLLGDLEQAEHWLQIAVAISDEAPEFLRLLAQFYAEDAYNLSPDGVQALLNTLEVETDDPDLRAAFGWALHSVGETVAGLQQIQIVLDEYPQHPRALYEMGRILLDVGDEEGAAAVFQQLAALDSEYSDDAQRILERLGS